jgi:hypothetical protein
MYFKVTIPMTPERSVISGIVDPGGRSMREPQTM